MQRSLEVDYHLEPMHILKYNIISFGEHANITTFTGNSADYGGAVYVNDDTNSGTCASGPNLRTECFFQALALYSRFLHDRSINPRLLNFMYFSNNSADISGSTLYGGLLDRCAVSQFAEFDVDNNRGGGNREGIAYFKNVSTIANVSISSGPVQVCFCTISSSMHDCTDQDCKFNKEVKKCKAFTMSLVAVDQVGQPVNATIQASLSSAESGLSEG